MENVNQNISLPLSIIRHKNLSPRAKIIWGELTLLPRDEAQHFAVNTKAVAQILNCCPGTLRRAIKILLEQKLIEYVETNKLRERIYRFTTIIIENTRKKENPSQSPFEKVRSEIPDEKPEVETPVVVAVHEDLTPEKDENGMDKLLCISWNPGRALCEDDRDYLMIAESLNKEMTPVFQKQFPSLNGTQGKPRIDLSLIQYFVMTNTHLGMLAVCTTIKKTLWDYSQNGFIPRPDMHVEWR